MPPLQDDQFDERLQAMLRDEDAADLTGIEEEEDATDLILMREALDNYKAETLRLAEQQSAAMPTPRVPQFVALWDSTPRWAVAATAVLAFGCTSVFVTHRNAEPVPMAMVTAPTAQILQDDNRLLLSVDEALQASATPTEEELGLTAIPAQTTRHGRATN